MQSDNIEILCIGKAIPATGLLGLNAFLIFH